MRPSDERGREPEPASEPGTGVAPDELETERETAPAAETASPAPDRSATGGVAGSEAPGRAAANGAGSTVAWRMIDSTARWCACRCGPSSAGSLNGPGRTSASRSR